MNFKKGQRVRHIPFHANRDKDHPHCEDGVASLVNEEWVFVKYDNIMCIMMTGDEPYAAQVTNLNDLILR